KRRTESFDGGRQDSGGGETVLKHCWMQTFEAWYAYDFGSYYTSFTPIFLKVSKIRDVREYIGS
ncbi:MAG: hypothetical protein ACLTAC_28400, partial [Hungatella sp.]